MAAKSAIAERLGEHGVLLPSLLSNALQANERIKLRLSLLQEAVAQARNPRQNPPVFAAERRKAGLGAPQFDTTVSGATDLGQDMVLVPGSTALFAGISSDLSAMLAPIETVGTPEADAFSRRLKSLTDAITPPENDAIAAATVAQLTKARRETGDSMHLLIMDMHQAINRLMAETAPETIEGAKLHCARPEDRPRIKAFMTGINRTRVLAFGHPGLGTTAVRTGERLTIQNDIGTTEAHVLMIHVEGLEVTITYTDVHLPRAKFFMALFEGRMVDFGPLTERDARGVGEDKSFYLVNGTFKAENEEQLMQFLEYLGSRIVFLIDWNKARKALQTFTSGSSAISLLTFAAANDCGHRAFLELGGAQLVFEAIRRVAEGRIPYGARLEDVLGEAETQDFLRHVLLQTSRGLLAGRSARLIRDEIGADLSQRFEKGEITLFMIVLRHLGLSHMLAASLYGTLSAGSIAAAFERQHIAARSKKLEEKADRLTASARELAARLPNGANLRQTVDSVEDALDNLDESAFLLSLIPEPELADGLASPLASLAGLAVESISHLVRAIEAAAQMPEGLQSDARDALGFIDEVLNTEHHADHAERMAMRACVGAPSQDARGLVLGLEIARVLENATDHLAHAALSLRDHVLADLSA